MMMKKPLKLKAETTDDLSVIASALQDAILKVGEVHYGRDGHYLTVRLSRFRHEDNKHPTRILSALRLDGVLGVQSRGLKRDDPEALAVLLSIRFTPGSEAPEGYIDFIFAGDGQLRLHVECIDILLVDLSEGRITDKIPHHPVHDDA